MRRVTLHLFERSCEPNLRVLLDNFSTRCRPDQKVCPFVGMSETNRLLDKWIDPKKTYLNLTNSDHETLLILQCFCNANALGGSKKLYETATPSHLYICQYPQYPGVVDLINCGDFGAWPEVQPNKANNLSIRRTKQRTHGPAFMSS
jgi:hypothetical protein